MAKKRAKRVIKTYWDASKKKVKYLKPVDEKDRLHGWVVRFYPSGRVAARGLFKNGRVVGAPETYYDAVDLWNRPLLKSKIPFINKMRNGIEKFWNEYGQLRRETNWVNDKREGIERRYAPFCVTETVYKEDKRNGIEETRHVNGYLLSRVMYENDKKTGLEIINDEFSRVIERYYTPDAVYEVKIDYKHNCLNFKIYQSDFKSCLNTISRPMDQNWREKWLLSEQSPAFFDKIQERFLSDEGKQEQNVQKIPEKRIPMVPRSKIKIASVAKMVKTPDYITTYYDEEGLFIQSETPIKNSRRHGVARTFSPTGVCIKTTTYRFGTQHGPEVLYDKDGFLIAKRLFEKNVCRLEKKYTGHNCLWRETHFDKNGQMDGADIYYYPVKEGSPLKIKSKAMYSHGNRVGELVKYFKSGQLAEHIPVNGRGYTYNQLGRILSEGFYQNGVLHGMQTIFDDSGNVVTRRLYENGTLKSEIYTPPLQKPVIQMLLPGFERE